MISHRLSQPHSVSNQSFGRWNRSGTAAYRWVQNEQRNAPAIDDITSDCGCKVKNNALNIKIIKENTNLVKASIFLYKVVLGMY